jgi:threonyl-tRNA synthetase
MKYNYTIVLGAKEEQENTVTIRNLGNKNMSAADALAFFQDEINTYKKPENTTPQIMFNDHEHKELEGGIKCC